MNTFLAATTLLVAAFAAGASAQVPSLPVPATSPLPPVVPRKETLRLKFPVGQTLYYTLTEDTAGSYLEPHRRIIPIKSHLEMQEHQTVADLRETDSAGLVDMGVDSMTVTVDDKPSPLPSGALAAMTALTRLIVLKNGKLEATVVDPGFNAEEVLTGEDPAHLNVLSGLGELPAAPVQAGDKWKSVSFLGMTDEHSTADVLLAAWETKDAATIAVIKQAIHGQFGTPAAALSDPKADDLKIKGWLSGTRTVRLNVEAGTIDSADSLVYMTVLLTPKGDDGKYTAAPTRMWVKVTSKTTQTSAPAEVPPAPAEVPPAPPSMPP